MKGWRLPVVGNVRWTTVQYVILAGILGLALLFFRGTQRDPGWPAVDRTEPETPRADGHDLGGLEREMARALADILGRVQGAGRVWVQVTLAEGPEAVYEQDRQESTRVSDEKDAQGGSRVTEEHSSTLSLVMARSGGNDYPVKSKVVAPRLRGVLVVAQGASDPEVRSRLINSVSVLTDLPAHRIQVVPAE